MSADTWRTTFLHCVNPAKYAQSKLIESCASDIKNALLKKEAAGLGNTLEALDYWHMFQQLIAARTSTYVYVELKISYMEEVRKFLESVKSQHDIWDVELEIKSKRFIVHFDMSKILKKNNEIMVNLLRICLIMVITTQGEIREGYLKKYSILSRWFMPSIKFKMPLSELKETRTPAQRRYFETLLRNTCKEVKLSFAADGTVNVSCPIDNQIPSRNYDLIATVYCLDNLRSQ